MQKTECVLAVGFKKARQITKQHAKTFYAASHFLNKEKKMAAYALYAICRLSDEAVDSVTEGSPEDNLNNLQKTIDSIYGISELHEPLLLAVRATVQKFAIPKRYFDALIDGMRMDLTKNHYNNFTELHDYSYKVAGVVGLMMLHVFGYSNNNAKEHAVELGLALQLTNILRDIKEDLSRGRIYLPKEELASFGVSENDLAQEIINDNFIRLMKFQIQRARRYYDNSAAGIPMIKDSRSRFVVSAMKEMYAGILNAIERNHYDIFSQRARVSAAGKLGILLRIITKGAYK